jgi:hypothetical protein|nr:MAG TPA: hypothetical protein [Caudoviricetes sp.]
MIFKTIKSEEVKFENVADVFNTKRNERNEYFGKYVAEVTDVNPSKLNAVANKIKMLEKEYNLYLANLKVLADAVDVEKKEADAKILTAQINGMNEEQLAALKAAIDAKMNQQQN